jgi:mRNA interferase RelE/StbE
MSLSIKISKQAGKFVGKLPPKQYKQVVGTVLSLMKMPEPHDSKVLKGSKDNNRRVDIGEYRIVYREQNETILVLVIGKRNDDEVYKILARQPTGKTL